jgi:hypothetical protein
VRIALGALLEYDDIDPGKTQFGSKPATDGAAAGNHYFVLEHTSIFHLDSAEGEYGETGETVSTGGDPRVGECPLA